MHQRQRPRQQSQGDKIAFFLLQRPPIEQIQAGKQQRPAEQSGPLGNQQIGHRVDPADVFLHIVGGGLVKGGEDAGEVGPVPTPRKKVQKSEPAASKKQPIGHRRPALAFQPAVKQQVSPQQHTGHGPDHGQHVGPAQSQPQLAVAGGDAVAEEGIAQGGVGEQGIEGRELLLPRQAGDEGQVHGHISIGALAGVQAAVRRRKQSVGVEQIAKKQPQGHAAGRRPLPALPVRRRPEGPAFFRRRQPSRQHQGRKGRQPLGPGGKVQQKGPQSRQPHGQRQPRNQSQPQPQQPVFFG